MEISELYKMFLNAGAVTTDTRAIKEGDIFFALKGENFNGNKFANQALESGASYAVIDEKEFVNSNKTILVDDVLTILQALAQYHRNQLNIPFIAVTGSNGKTTTKELLNAVLSKKYNVSYTLGNLNNHIGVPLTLLRVDSTHDMALIEMGDNHQGEVELLCDIAQPTHGFVTNVGKDHLEGFGSMENNMKAKKEVFDFLQVHHGKAFVDVNDDIVMSLVEKRMDCVTYGAEGSFSVLKFKGSNPFVVIEGESGKEVETHMFGAYNFSNMNLAYCVGKFFDVSESDIMKALGEYEPTNNRSQIIKTPNNTLILDAYNANPSSVEEAMKSLAEMETELPKMIVLGDMFELGSYSEEEHQNMADLAELGGFDSIVLIGENYAKVKQSITAHIYASKEEARLGIKKIAPEGAIILFKGSRGMRLETLVDLF